MADILFVNSMDTVRIKHEVNGTMILATKLLQAGFDVDILRFGQIEGCGKDYSAFISNAVERILAMKPRCVSFYTLWSYYHVMLRIAREVKMRNNDIVIVMGGPQASTTARETMQAMEFVDYICTGEGENTVVPFFRTVLEENGANAAAVPGLYYRENGTVRWNEVQIPLCDLNTLPYWDDRLYIGNGGASEKDITSDTYFMPIDAGRGCPYGCTFCCISRFWRRTYRLKSPERMVEDIRYYNRKFGIRSFWFTHDAFTTNQRLVEKVCDYILESGLDIKWRCTARINCLSEELILKMKQAGMTQIEMGIETGSPRMQKIINKNLDLSRAKQIVSFLLKNKIGVSLFFMYGFPEETEQDLNETLELLLSMLDLGVGYASMSFCNFNPATKITNQYFDQLVYDPEMKVLTRSIRFGYREELEVIRANKALFPFFYHLNTPVRNEYQYVTYLVKLYGQLPDIMKQIRRLYGGDHLKFYRDYYEGNRGIFDQELEHATDILLHHPWVMVENMLEKLTHPKIRQLRGLIRFQLDKERVRKAQGDQTIRETYTFNYVDLQMKLPIEQYSGGKTEILLQKKDGVLRTKVLRIDFED